MRRERDRFDEEELELLDADKFHDDHDEHESIFNPDRFHEDEDDDAPLLASGGGGSHSNARKRTLSWRQRLESLLKRKGQTKSSSLGDRRRRRTSSRCTLCCCLIFLLISTISYFLFGYFYFRPAELPPPTLPDKSTNSTARFLTLNIFMRPPGVKNNKSDYKEQRLDYIIKYILPHYDVITIQEAFAFANRRIDHLAVEARNLGFNYQVASPRHYPWELAADGGLLLLSRFPIKQADTLEFPRGIHADWLSKKGALHALVQLNATRTVHLYTTHTQASYDEAGALNQEDTLVRLSQFALVHDFIRNTARDDGSPVLIMGDLNIDAAAHKDEDIRKPSVASSQAYTMMMQVLNGTGIQIDNQTMYSDPDWRIDTLHDVAYQQFGYHPVTFGDFVRNTTTQKENDLIPAETVLTHWDQLLTVQSIDRILWADRYSHDVTVHNITVEKFLTKDNKELDSSEREAIPFTQISDHYGLSCIVELV
ncbi:sphingomyelinase c [Lichtheimia corymbifera JMRC:FSU:9682]|uniref:sphingomyelin phosphodiesterase n=1 Tax=Lichtheimia corymbifera JMRC:FSU:9682 TaxID=1263082 RepID=A0A068S158_9FUNG|nr:sphingomyelinase c [Lichtheimia corymbifera JMRC:FSU:9682]